MYHGGSIVMEQMPANIADRLARLEGQYYALSKELSDGFKELHGAVDEVRKQVESLQNVKSGMLRSESLGDVLKRLDDRVNEMHKQVVALTKTFQTR